MPYLSKSRSRSSKKDYSLPPLTKILKAYKPSYANIDSLSRLVLPMPGARNTGWPRLMCKLYPNLKGPPQ